MLNRAARFDRLADRVEEEESASQCAGWNEDHIVASYRDIANRFVSWSELGRLQVEQIGRVQEYLLYWRIAYTVPPFAPSIWISLTTHSSSP